MNIVTAHYPKQPEMAQENQPTPEDTAILKQIQQKEVLP